MQSNEQSSQVVALEFEQKKDIRNLNTVSIDFLLGSLQRAGFEETRKMTDLRHQFSLETNVEELQVLASQYLDLITRVADKDKTLMAGISVHIFMVALYFPIQNFFVKQLYTDSVDETLEAITNAEGFVDEKYNQTLIEIYEKLASLAAWLNL